MNLLTIVLLAIITFTSRYLFLDPSLPIRIGPKVGRFLSFSAPAVLTAIWVPIIFVKDSQLNLSPTNPYLLAALVAIVVAKKTSSIYLTLSASVVFFVLLRLYLPV